MSQHSPLSSRRARNVASFAPWRRILAEFAWAGGAGLVSTAAAWIGFRLTPETFAERWGTGGPDQVLHYMIFRSAHDVFPFLPNSSLGFPNAQNLFFAPLFDPWSAIFVSIAGWFTSDSVVILNLYDLVGFFSTAFTAVLFFRLLGLVRPLSVTFGLAFALLPLHFMQLALGHPFLANYWAVPLSGVLVLMVGGRTTNPFDAWISRAASGRVRLLRRWIPIAALALLVGLTQSYYFVFAVIVTGGILFMKALRVVVTRDSWKQLVWPALTVASLVTVVAIQLGILSLNFHDRYEKYFSARSAGESELYGGKIASLILPWPQTGVPRLGALSQRYFSLSSVVPTSEGPWSSILVVVAIVVSVLLLFAVIITPTRLVRRPIPTLEAITLSPKFALLSATFLWTLLFYVTGGLGVIFAVVVSPEIRAWSRISVVLSLAVLGIFALLVQELARRPWILRIVIAIIAVLVVVDQVGGALRSVPLSPMKDSALKSLVAEMEQRLAPGCGVVELPLKAFPESGNIGAMGDYDHGLPYLYSTTLKWSYGAVRGTIAGDYWDGVTGTTATAERIRESGACAVLVNTSAYENDQVGWMEIVDKLSKSSNPDFSSSDGIYKVFLLG